VHRLIWLAAQQHKTIKQARLRWKSYTSLSRQRLPTAANYSSNTAVSLVACMWSLSTVEPWPPVGLAYLFTLWYVRPSVGISLAMFSVLLGRSYFSSWRLYQHHYTTLESRSLHHAVLYLFIYSFIYYKVVHGAQNTDKQASKYGSKQKQTIQLNYISYRTYTCIAVIIIIFIYLFISFHQTT